jgi:hypothetical protein
MPAAESAKLAAKVRAVAPAANVYFSKVFIVISLRKEYISGGATLPVSRPYYPNNGHGAVSSAPF